MLTSSVASNGMCAGTQAFHVISLVVWLHCVWLPSFGTRGRLPCNHRVTEPKAVASLLLHLCTMGSGLTRRCGLPGVGSAHATCKVCRWVLAGGGGGEVDRV